MYSIVAWTHIVGGFLPLAMLQNMTILCVMLHATEQPVNFSVETMILHIWMRFKIRYPLCGMSDRRTCRTPSTYLELLSDISQDSAQQQPLVTTWEVVGGEFLLVLRRVRHWLALVEDVEARKMLSYLVRFAVLAIGINAAPAIVIKPTCRYAQKQ